MDRLFEAARHYEGEAIRIRRDLHHYPEAAWTEFRTTSKIIHFLREHGVPFVFGKEVIHPEYTWSYPAPEVLEMQKARAVSQGADPELVAEMDGYTGVVATIDSGKPGKTIAFRFDMDCVEVDETKDPAHRPNAGGYASVNPHCMHSCGHDGHTAMGLILAAVLNECKEEWSGKAKIIYQPGEEGDKGAQSMVEKGVLDGVDMVFGMHIFPTDGPFPAIAGTQMGLYATTKFDVTIHGKSAHAGAAPETGKNAILAAVHAISGMQCFYQDGGGATRLNIGTIQGGSGRNVIPEHCFFRAETRGSDTEVEQRIYQAAVRSVKTSCELFDCTFEIKTMGYGPTGNGDRDLAEAIAEIVKDIPEVKASRPLLFNTGGTDDFAYMMNHLQKQGKKSCYLALLTRTDAGLHNSAYDFDESCLTAGVESCLALMKRFGASGSVNEA